MNDIAYAQIKEVAVGLPDADHFITATPYLASREYQCLSAGPSGQTTRDGSMR